MYVRVTIFLSLSPDTARYTNIILENFLGAGISSNFEIRSLIMTEESPDIELVRNSKGINLGFQLLSAKQKALAEGACAAILDWLCISSILQSDSIL